MDDLAIAALAAAGAPDPVGPVLRKALGEVSEEEEEEEEKIDIMQEPGKIAGARPAAQQLPQVLDPPLAPEAWEGQTCMACLQVDGKSLPAGTLERCPCNADAAGGHAAGGRGCERARP